MCLTSKELRDLIEIIYFISGPIIAIGSIVALKQYLKFSKDINDKYGREIARQVIEDITIFNRVIIAGYRNYKTELKDQMAFYFDGELTNLNDENLLKSASSFDENIPEKAKKEAEELILELNKMSLSFELGISDEKNTFDRIGVQFLEIFEQLSFKAIIMITETQVNLNSLFATYKRWRIWRDIEKSKSALSEKKREFEQLTDMSEKPTKPIGSSITK